MLCLAPARFSKIVAVSGCLSPNSCFATSKLCLILQSPLVPQATAAVVELGKALVTAPPAGPGDDLVRRVRGRPDEADEEAPDLGDSDWDVERAVAGPPF